MIRRFILPLLAALMALLPGAHAQPVDGGRAMVELIAERESVVPGETFYAAIKMDLDTGWHVYWRNAGDAGLPPRIDLRDGSDIADAALGPFVWPIPHLLPVVEGEIMDYGYDDRLILPFPLTIPADATGSVQVNLLADYLICEEICIPETVEISLTLPVGDSEPHIANGTLIGEWVAKAPRDFGGEARIDASGAPWKLSLKTEGGFDTGSDIRFYPFGHEISHPADQRLSFGRDGATLSLTPADDSLEGPLEGIIVVETADGTRTGYTLAAGQGAVFENTSGIAARAAFSGAGGKSLIALALAAVIGGLILNLMPCVLPVLSIKAMGMVQAVASGHESEVRSHGLWYTAGVLISFAALAAAIVAIRQATGTANLGFQLQNGPTVAVLTLIMFVIGLWLLGMFELGSSIQNTGSSLASRSGSMGAFFTGVLAAVVGAPCIGPFLGAALGAVLDRPAVSVLIVFLAMGFGLALPYLVLSFVPGLSRLLPRPGRWMETLKQFFAFPMFLTAALLLWTLGAVSGPAAVAWTVAGGTLIAFGIWLARRSRGTLTKVLAALAMIGGLVYPALTANSSAALTAEGGNSQYAEKYETEAWSPDRVTDLTDEGRPVFVDFTATWCATCQLNKVTTLKSKAVHEAFAAHDVAFLVADFTRKDPVIAEELKRRQRAGVPMYLWYPAGATEPQILPEVLSQKLVIGLVTAE
ncbi:protein-disulfide reductase DsbD domain-containing protein [Hyphomonas sp.]|jgi:thiol:disulfide interchange protein DsbD|uniref:protein-disulfide reductase DsbD family protein n=1 Tax=Hyphomonas sp. TaxID=87 RepID=UPI0032D905E0